MNFKLALSTATALGLLMGAAYADDNQNYLTQSGGNNNAFVDQTGGGGNVVGTSGDPALQHGDYNNVDVTQSDGSTLGVAGTYTGGVDQIDDYNVLAVDQKNGRIQEVQQTGADGATNVTNTLTITQSDNVVSTTIAINQVGFVRQTYTGTTGGADRNSVTIDQSFDVGVVTTNHRNLVNKVTQDGNRDSVTISQVTGFNTLGTVSQTGGTHNVATISQGSVAGGHQNSTNAVIQQGSDNLAVLHQNGSYNGGGLGNPGRLAAGNYDAAVIQKGDFNDAGLTIDGDHNAYAINQQGDRNIATGLSITGDGNGLGVGQYGEDNLVTLANISDDGNQVGLQQSGDRNEITGLGFGSNGIVDILQGGNDNAAVFSQAGEDNVIGVDIDGDRNHLNMVQNNPDATGNTMSVSITGSDNNNWPSNNNTLTGDARSAYDVAHFDNSLFVGQGSLYQTGSDNSLTMTVSSDLNAFATYQKGTGNTIEHTISGGDANQAVIAQIGSGNMSVTMQMGAGNNLGVSQ
jgi:hypothetical protein